MTKIVVATLSVVLILAGCGMGDSSDAPLTRAECRTLLEQFDQILAKHFKSEPDGVSDEDVDECVVEQNWNRWGFECAMKAKRKGDLDKCILRQ